MTPPAYALRSLPASALIAVLANPVGSLVLFVAFLASSGEPFERIEATERWRMFAGGCAAVQVVLLAAALLELARRHAGGTRTLVRIAAALVLAGLGWDVLELALAPREYGEGMLAIYTWSGRVLGVVHLAMIGVLVTAADGWRRLPLPAIGLVVLALTSYWVPVIGTEIRELLGSNLVLRQGYGLARVLLTSTCMLFVLAGVAARAGAPSADLRRAVDGLVLARAALYVRLLAAGLFLLLAIGIRSRGTQQLVFTAAPVIIVISLAVFAAATLRVAGARVHGLPVFRLALGAALVVWWAAVQHEQLVEILRSRARDGDGDALLGMYSLAGPIVMTLGLALVGSAITTYARTMGDAALGSSATTLTGTFVGLSLASVGFLALIAKATSLSGAMGMLLVAVLAQVAALLVLGALLGRAARAVATGPQVPPARVL